MIYPSWWDTTITIYNRIENPTTQLITWQKRIIKGCFWKIQSGSDISGNTSSLNVNTICRIPQQKNFKERYEWETLDDDKRIKYFTIGIGDIIVRGCVGDVINEYQNGKRSTDLLAKYSKQQRCIEVQSFDINTNTGLGLPHYKVLG